MSFGTFDAKSKEHPVRPIGVSYISANPTVVHETFYKYDDDKRRWIPFKPEYVSNPERQNKCSLVEINFPGNQQSITVVGNLDDLNIEGIGIFTTSHDAREKLKSYSV